MTAATAKAAGVKNIICTAPSNKQTGRIHPTTLYGMKKAGATQILALGGIQGVGEIVVVPSREEAVRVCDRYAPEHLEILTSDLEYYHTHPSNYGSLFLGEGSTVTHGDKASGPNHVLPTRRVARYTGGLSVEKFLKKLTWQKLSKESSKTIGVTSARIARMEGMEGHARASDVRLEKFFPGEKFNLQPGGNN